MLYIIAIIVGIVIALVLGGSFSNFASFKFQKGWLIIVAFTIQIVARLAAQKCSAKIVSYALFINIIAYCLLLTGFWLNREYFGIKVISVGSGLNILAILLNGGRMPVNYEALLRNNMDRIIDLINRGLDFKHVLIDESTKVLFLTDIIQLPGIFGYLMRVVSIGDLIIALGICVFIFEIFIGINLNALLEKADMTGKN